MNNQQRVDFIIIPYQITHAHCRMVEDEVSSGSKSGTSKRRKKSGKKGDSVFVPDTEAILADFQLMGEGLVKRVEILSPPPSLH